MSKNNIGTLNVNVYQISGEKDNKKYNFLALEIEIDGKKFTLYPKKENKQLFDYLLAKEIGY